MEEARLERLASSMRKFRVPKVGAEIKLRIYKILFLVVIVYVLIFSRYGLVKIISIKVNIWKVHNEIEILQAKEVVLERETKLLENPEYIKKVAREHFGIE